MFGVAGLTIRQYGDPVLKERTREVVEIDAAVVALAESMIETMYDAPGSGLAANQVGVQRRIFVYDVGEGPRTVINPRIVESDGEWTYDEGCLSDPGLSWDDRATQCAYIWSGLDLDGNEISIEADRVGRPGLPARTRSSRRHLVGGAARRRPAQRGPEDSAGTHVAPGGGGPRRPFDASSPDSSPTVGEWHDSHFSGRQRWPSPRCGPW